MMSPDTKKKVRARLRRIAGQVSGLERMIEDDRYCVDILLQIAAVASASRKVGEVILASHVETCVSEALQNGRASDRARKLKELVEVFSRYGRV